MAELAFSEPVLMNGYQVGTCQVEGGARSSRFAPAGYSLWQVVGELEAGTELTWDGTQGDEALYVVNGGLENGSASAQTTGAIIVESGVATTVRATVATTVVHSGSVTHESGLVDPPQTGGHGVHVFRDVKSVPTIGAGNVGQVCYFSDGACRTCRLAYFVVDGTVMDEPYASSSHVHTLDEIFHVLKGTLQIGGKHAEPGTSIAIPAEYRYSYRTAGPFQFLNFRAGPSSVVYQPGQRAWLQTLEEIPRLVAERRPGHRGASGS